MDSLFVVRTNENVLRSSSIGFRGEVSSVIPSFEDNFIAMKPKAPHPKGKNNALRNAHIGRLQIKTVQAKPILYICAIEDIFTKRRRERILERLSCDTIPKRIGYSFRFLKADGTGGRGINPSMGEDQSDRYT